MSVDWRSSTSFFVWFPFSDYLSIQDYFGKNKGSVNKTVKMGCNKLLYDKLNLTNKTKCLLEKWKFMVLFWYQHAEKVVTSINEMLKSLHVLRKCLQIYVSESILTKLEQSFPTLDGR